MTGSYYKYTRTGWLAGWLLVLPHTFAVGRDRGGTGRRIVLVEMHKMHTLIHTIQTRSRSECVERSATEWSGETALH